MAPKTVKDQIANVAYLHHTQVGAATLEFARLDIVSGALLGEKKYGLLLLKAEYYTQGIDAATNFALEDDQWRFGLCVTDALADTGLHHPEIITLAKMGSYLRASPGGNVNDIVSFPSIEPFTVDFAAYGGILVPADRLYLFSDTTLAVGADAGMEVQCRLYYTTQELSTEQYWELIEARRIIST